MGILPEQTEAMGPFSVEVRHESFYLFDDPDIQQGIGFLLEFFPSVVGDRLDGEILNMAVYVVEQFVARQPSPIRTAWHQVISELHRALAAEQEWPNRVKCRGSIELNIKDIPKIRAALDQVEEVVARR